jgi:hypothetical protein
VFFSAMLIVRLYDRLPPRLIARYALLLVTAGMAWLALVVRNDWSALPVVFGLIAIGIGQGALMTLLFNVLVTASPRQFAGDVGSLRGTAINLAFSVGTAIAGALAVGLLAAIVTADVGASTRLSPTLRAEVNLDSINFVANDQLRETLAATSASADEIDAAVRINTDARLRALKLSFLILSLLALLAIVPSGRLPAYQPAGAPPPKSPPPPRHRNGSAPSGVTIN